MTIKFAVTCVKDIMTPNPVLISPDATLQEAAKKMESANCGALPVGTEGALQGMITDRDIIIRAIAQCKNPINEKVSDYMTQPAYCCNENDMLEDAAAKMHKNKVSRLVVMDGDNNVTGILSFGTIFRNDALPEEIAGVVKHAAGPVSI